MHRWNCRRPPQHSSSSFPLFFSLLHTHINAQPSLVQKLYICMLDMLFFSFSSLPHISANTASSRHISLTERSIIFIQRNSLCRLYFLYNTGQSNGYLNNFAYYHTYLCIQISMYLPVHVSFSSDDDNDDDGVGTPFLPCVHYITITIHQETNMQCTSVFTLYFAHLSFLITCRVAIHMLTHMWALSQRERDREEVARSGEISTERLVVLHFIFCDSDLI